MENTKIISSAQTLFLEKPPCCLEFCPNSPDYFVVGTYNLIRSEDSTQPDTDVKDEQQRNGSLLLYKLQDGQMQLQQSVKTPYGVLDVHFSHCGDALLAVATSTGSLALYSCALDHDGTNEVGLRHAQTFQLFERTIVVTSVAWDTKVDDILYISASNGEVIQFTIPDTLSRNPASHRRITEELSLPDNKTSNEDDNDDARDDIVYTHELEAWTVINTPQTWPAPQTFSGGDDAALIGPNLHNKRIHEAGVTAILPLTPGILATGSYDDHLRIIKLPDQHSRRPEVLHEINLGGGVWRLKLLEPLPSSTSEKFCVRVLVSCMYAGAFVVMLNGGPQAEDWSVEGVAHFAEHESMNYACDVQSGAGNEARTIVSCSFYDRRLCLWYI